MKTEKNLASLFTLFDSDRPDKTAKAIRIAGVVVANIVFGLIVVAEAIKVFRDDTKAFESLMLAAAFGWVATILLFVALGTHYAGRDAGKKNFLGSLWYVLGKTFLYVLLPCMLIAGALIIWAIITKQPAFS